ncbi:MAG: histidine kinase [Chloroflexi bacterium]|nr:histidine kinase [Chloroflexota bacterium]
MIDQLHQFFEINDVIVQFVHGQVFLLLGVTMGLQYFRPSRLELARALPWLAAFGLFEAVATWGNSFIPLQESVLVLEMIRNLRFLQLFVHLLSFASLLGFGLRLSEPTVPPWAVPTLTTLMTLIFGAFFITNHLLYKGISQISTSSLEALLRYALCMPSALLVAFGLRQQASRLIGPLQVPRLVNHLRVAGFGFIFYAIAEGVLVPFAPFLLASFFNTSALFESSGIPIGIIRGIVGAVIAWFMVRSLEAFRIEADRLAEALHNQQALNTERERISRDLHDGTLQNIYAAGLMIDDARHALAVPHEPSQVAHAQVQLGNVMTTLNKTTQEIRGYIYDLRRSVMGEEDLARGLLDIVTEFRLRTSVSTEWAVEGSSQFTSTPEQRYHIYQIVREAFSNILRHSGATQVHLWLSYCDCVGETAHAVRIEIGDNGRGALATARVGKGLLNMRERAHLLQAEFDIHSEADKGTRIVLIVRS